ncbi:MAG: RloB family protein [Sulfuriferula sp.]
MGSDDLFHRRKARKNNELERQKKDRARSQRFLIVCEGTKTESYYLKEMIDDLRIRPQAVKIAPNAGTSPDRVVAHAIKLYEEDAIGGDSFDRVFCVFDKDTHSTFGEAVQKISGLKEADTPKPFEAITSVPCFEYWLLLHFEFTDQPFHAAGKKSVCDSLITILRAKPNLNKYGKGQHGIYGQLKDKTSIAIKGAKQVRKNVTKGGQDNPSTQVDVLVEALQLLAKNNGALNFL